MHPPGPLRVGIWLCGFSHQAIRHPLVHGIVATEQSVRVPDSGLFAPEQSPLFVWTPRVLGRLFKGSDLPVLAVPRLLCRDDNECLGWEGQGFVPLSQVILEQEASSDPVLTG